MQVNGYLTNCHSDGSQSETEGSAAAFLPRLLNFRFAGDTATSGGQKGIWFRRNGGLRGMVRFNKIAGVVDPYATFRQTSAEIAQKNDVA